MLGIALASRGRPEQFNRLLQEISEAKTMQDTFLSVRLDEDDRELANYKPKDFFKGEVFVKVGKRLCVGSAPHINEAAMEAYRLGASLIMQAADDQSYKGARAFDYSLMRTALQVPDRMALFYVADGYLNEKTVSHPIVTKEWIKEVGYFYSSEYKHFYADTDLMDIAKRAGRLLYKGSVFIPHDKHGNKDKLYYEIRGEGTDPDELVFQGREEERKAIAVRILQKATGQVML